MGPYHAPSACDHQSGLLLNLDASATIFQTMTHSEAATAQHQVYINIHLQCFTNISITLHITYVNHTTTLLHTILQVNKDYHVHLASLFTLMQRKTLHILADMTTGLPWTSQSLHLTNSIAGSNQNHFYIQHIASPYYILY